MRLLYHAVPVVVMRTHGAAVGSECDLAHPRVGAQVHTVLEGARPVGQVRGRERFLRASKRAPAPVVTGRPPAVRLGGDGLLRRPPVPAELFVSVDKQLTRASQRRGRAGKRVSGGTAWGTGQAGDANLGLVDRVVRRQLLIRERPIDANAVESPDPEVRRGKPPDVARKPQLASA